MKRAFGILMLIGFLVLAYFFFVAWRGTKPWGVGTGEIGGRSSAATSNSRTSSSRTSSGKSATASGKTTISQIAARPQQWKGKRATVSGRVRGSARYASNRNVYRLTDGTSIILVVDDKAPPKEYSLRVASGVVKVLQPPAGKAYAYIVNIKSNPKIDLQWKDVKVFFSERASEVKKSIHAATN